MCISIIRLNVWFLKGRVCMLFLCIFMLVSWCRCLLVVVIMCVLVLM